MTAVVGPLATYAEPHAYDLCDEHSERLSAPRGWEVLRLALDPAALGPRSDDLPPLPDPPRPRGATLRARADAGGRAPGPPQPAGGRGGPRVRAVPAGAAARTEDE